MFCVSFCFYFLSFLYRYVYYSDLYKWYIMYILFLMKWHKQQRARVRLRRKENERNIFLWSFAFERKHETSCTFGRTWKRPTLTHNLSLSVYWFFIILNYILVWKIPAVNFLSRGYHGDAHTVVPRISRTVPPPARTHTHVNRRGVYEPESVTECL